MTETALARARAGDGDAFRELVAPFLRELRVHSYRILGSLQDAEDALQETLVAAWRGLDRFESAMVPPPAPTRLGETLWLQPFPDALLEGIEDEALGPDARYEANEAITLTFVNALQHLPSRQRCVLVLRDVLGFASVEVATILDTADTSVKAALLRARHAASAPRCHAGRRRDAAADDTRP